MFLLLAKINKTVLARLLDKDFCVISEKKRQNGDLLKTINELLRENKKIFADVANIFVVNDSGTFSGIRSVVTAGNILSFALKIPITSVSIKDIDNKRNLKIMLGRKTHFAAPKYGGKPNITIKN